MTGPRSLTGPTIDWRNESDYSDLLPLDRQSFAWEWLRRNPRYRLAWDYRRGANEDSSPDSFGVVVMVDPSLPATIARPIWRAEVDKSVLIAEVRDADASPLEGLDLLAIASLVTLEVDRDNDEHVLLTDGKASVRLDITRGTLLGGRALLDINCGA